MTNQPTAQPAAEEATRLLPCPFCGSSDFLDNTWTTLGFGVVICSECEAEGPRTASNHICEAQAKEAAHLWNTRVQSAAVDAQTKALEAVRRNIVALQSIRKARDLPVAIAALSADLRRIDAALAQVDRLRGER